jgi:PIN domain
MIVVFDTNIWLQHLYLKSPVGAAVRFYILRTNASVALPEVIRLEVEHHLRKDIGNYIAQIKDHHGRLLAMFGRLKEVVLPNETEIEQKVSEAFVSLGINVIEVPFSIESAKSSFLKTIQKQAPSDKSQQFKDGVLWADCVSLLKRDDVTLVTDDKAFYEGREYAKGLAATLRDECTSFGRRLVLFSRLPDLLKVIQSEIAIDGDALTSAFLKGRKSIDGLLQRNGFQLAERTQISTELFVTEAPRVLFLEFKIAFRCTDISGEERGDGSLEVQGDGLYDSAAGTFSRLEETHSKLRYRDEEGVEKEYSNIILRAGAIVLGHREAVHTVRYKLD